MVIQFFLPAESLTTFGSQGITINCKNLIICWKQIGNLKKARFGPHVLHCTDQTIYRFDLFMFKGVVLRIEFAPMDIVECRQCS